MPAASTRTEITEHSIARAVTLVGALLPVVLGLLDAMAARMGLGGAFRDFRRLGVWMANSRFELLRLPPTTQCNDR